MGEACAVWSGCQSVGCSPRGHGTAQCAAGTPEYPRWLLTLDVLMASPSTHATMSYKGHMHLLHEGFPLFNLKAAGCRDATGDRQVWLWLAALQVAQGTSLVGKSSSCWCNAGEQ